MCLTAHWIDNNWLIYKELLFFELMSEKHNADKIKYRLIEICEKWTC